MKAITSTMGILTAAAALSACGGGGSSPSGNASAPVATTPAPIAVVAPPVVAAPPPMVPLAGTLLSDPMVSIYPAGSPQDVVFSAYRELRKRSGAGDVMPSPEISAGAQAHAVYSSLNAAGGISHSQDPGKPGFYAVSSTDRAAKAGFKAPEGYESTGVMEIMSSYSMTALIDGQRVAAGPERCLAELGSTLYHGASLLTNDALVGIGFDGAGFDQQRMCVINTAIIVKPKAMLYTVNVMPAGQLAVYPYPGQTGVLPGFWVAAESPRPPKEVLPNDMAGHVVHVNVNKEDMVNYAFKDSWGPADPRYPMLNSFSLKDAQGNLVPSVIVRSNQLDQPLVKPAPGLVLRDAPALVQTAIALIPLYELNTSARYEASVSITMTPASQPTVKTWSFTTRDRAFHLP